MGNRDWLITAGNGALGEARIRALLLNRFWVSTRSVDVNGADFLVELPSERRFTDLLSPTVGTVQAKFCKDDTTSHYIPIDYVIDSKKIPLEGFFVIVTVGHEDAAKNYILTSQEISLLPQGKGKSRGKFYLSSTAWNKTSARTSSEILEIIETTLKRRSNYQTERFIHSINVPDFVFTRTGLDSEWLLPIPNEHAFIPDAVYRVRSGVRPDIYSFDDLISAMQRVMTSRDASDVAKALEDVAESSDVTVSDDGRNYIHIRLIANYAADYQELMAAVSAHRRRLVFLRKNNLLAKFMQISEFIGSQHEEFFETNNNPKLVGNKKVGFSAPTHFAETEVEFDAADLTVIAVRTRLTTLRPQPNQGINSFSLGRQLYLNFIEDGSASIWRELHGLQIELLAKYYEILNPKDLIPNPKRPTHLIP